MERKTAVAAATGVSMAVLSATFAVAASVGALGFGSTPQPAAQAVAATAPPVTQSATTTAPAPSVRTVAHENGEHEGRDSAPAPTAPIADHREASTSHD